MESMENEGGKRHIDGKSGDEIAACHRAKP